VPRTSAPGHFELGFLGFLKNLKIYKSPHFTFFRFIIFVLFLYRLYLMLHFKRTLQVLLGLLSIDRHIYGSNRDNCVDQYDVLPGS